MPSPFESKSASELKQMIETLDDYDALYAFLVDRDHWQSGTGFIAESGSTLEGLSEATMRQAQLSQSIIQTGLKKSFSPIGLLSEIAERRVDAVLSKPPSMGYKLRRHLEEDEEPKEEESDLLREAGDALSMWMRRNGGLDALRKFAFNLTAFARAHLRLRIPAARMAAVRRAETPAQALQHIYVESVYPSASMYDRDDETCYDIGVVLLEGDDGENESVEATYHDPDEDGLLGNPLTRHAIHQGDDQVITSYDLDGHLLHYGDTTGRFISPEMMQQQRAINTASTVMRIVQDDAGFPARIIFNALPPGSWTNVTGDDGITEEVYVEDTDWRFRPREVTMLQGVETEDAEGNVNSISTPQMGVFPAANPANYEKEIRLRREQVLNEAHQLFVETLDDASSSGDSRMLALWDFLLDAGKLKERVDLAGTWLLGAAWNLALALKDDGERFQETCAAFDAKIHIPHLPAALVQSLIMLNKAGLRSKERIMGETGIEDIEAEVELIQSSNTYRLSIAKEASELVSSLVASGATMESAVKMVTKIYEGLLSAEDLEFEEPTAPSDGLPDPSGDGADPGTPPDIPVPVDRTPN